jgi:hypothetical protein
MSIPDKQMYKWMRHEVDHIANTQSFYDDAERLGTHAARALTDKKRSQITGLETLANSTQRVSDIFDYIKLRTARQEEWRTGDFGPELLDHMQTTLLDQRDRAFRALPDDLPDVSPEEQQHIQERRQQLLYLLLIRVFLAHLAAQYEYACMA